MRVLILNFILSTAVDGKVIRRPSNRDTMIYNVARGFVTCGHTVTLLASEEYRPYDSEDNDFEVVYFPSRIPRLFKPTLLPYPRGLASYLRCLAADFDMILSVESFSIPTLIASVICPSKLLIWQEVGVYQRMAREMPARFWCHVVARLFMGRVPTVAMSPGAHKFVSRFLSRVSDEIIAHGADETLFYPGEEAEDYFVVIAMLVSRKRVDTMIQSFADFTRNFPTRQTRLKIIGEGPEEAGLKRLSDKLGVADRVDFLGFMPHSEMTGIERKAKAFLVNTASDLNMVSVTEAIANGTPVLMNSVAETAAYVKQFQTGIVKDGWGADELEQMIVSYDEFHKNAVDARCQFTNTGVASRLCKIFVENNV